MKFVQKPPTDDPGRVTVRYKGLVEVQISSANREATRRNPQEILLKVSVDCRMTRGQSVAATGS